MEAYYRTISQAEDTEFNHPPSDLLHKEAPESVLMDAPETPEQENCETESVPTGAVDMQGKKKILVPELITMTKILFDRYRLFMYSCLNRCLRQGQLSRLIGEQIITPRITHEECTLSGVDFWRISREDFFADIGVDLKLRTLDDSVDWKGHLLLWCGFAEEDLFYRFEELTDDVIEKIEGLDPLSPFLIPYATNRRVDEISEEILDGFQRAALIDPKERNAHKLAESMRLTIQFHPVYEHGGVHSVVFFKEDPLEIGEDRVDNSAGDKKHIKATKGKQVIIPADTIVINTNVIKRDYSAYKRPEMVRLLRDITLGKINLIYARTAGYIAANAYELCYLMMFIFEQKQRVDLFTEDPVYQFNTIDDYDNQIEELRRMAINYCTLYGSIIFNMATIRLFYGIIHILPFVSAGKKRLAIIMRKNEGASTVEWAKQKGDKIVNKPITSVEFSETIYNMMEWGKSRRYKAVGRVSDSREIASRVKSSYIYGLHSSV